MSSLLHTSSLRSTILSCTLLICLESESSFPFDQVSSFQPVVGLFCHFIVVFIFSLPFELLKEHR